MTDDKRLKTPERQAISSEDSFVWVSAASLWEISIKASLGRIKFGKLDWSRELEANAFLELPITWEHAALAGSLPRHHNDPFDRMLIAQSQVEQLMVVSYDGAFRAYDASTLPSRDE